MNIKMSSFNSFKSGNEMSMNLVVRWIFCLFDKMVMAVTQWFVGLKMGEIYGIDITYGRCSLQYLPIERRAIKSWFCDWKLERSPFRLWPLNCPHAIGVGAKSRQLEKNCVYIYSVLWIIYSDHILYSTYLKLYSNIWRWSLEISNRSKQS